MIRLELVSADAIAQPGFGRRVVCSYLRGRLGRLSGDLFPGLVVPGVALGCRKAESLGEFSVRGREGTIALDPALIAGQSGAMAGGSPRDVWAAVDGVLIHELAHAACGGRAHGYLFTVEAHRVSCLLGLRPPAPGESSWLTGRAEVEHLANRLGPWGAGQSVTVRGR